MIDFNGAGPLDPRQSALPSTDHTLPRAGETRLSSDTLQSPLSHPFPAQPDIISEQLAPRDGRYLRAEFLIQGSNNSVVGDFIMNSQSSIWLAGAYESGPDSRTFPVSDFCGSRCFEIDAFDSFRILHAEYQDVLTEKNLTKLAALISQGETGLTLKLYDQESGPHGVLVGLSEDSIALMQIEDERVLDRNGRDIVSDVPLADIEAYRIDYSLPHAMNGNGLSYLESTLKDRSKGNRMILRMSGENRLFEGIISGEPTDGEITLCMVYERTTNGGYCGTVSRSERAFSGDQIAAFGFL